MSGLIRVVLLLAATALLARPCAAQQATGQAHSPYSLLSLDVGAAAAFNAQNFDGTFITGVQFTRLVPRTPGFDGGLHLFRLLAEEGVAAGYILDLGLAYAVPVAPAVSIAPGAGWTGAAVADADGGGANAGIYLGTSAIWRREHLTLRGGLTWRGYGVFRGELASLISVTVGVGFGF